MNASTMEERFVEEQNCATMLTKIKREALQEDVKEHQPVLVFPWKDEKPTGATGWVVLDQIINGVSGGGIFMHSDATQQETEAIAHNMSKKFTVCDPQIGGAKAGIRFNHRDPRAREVLRRFIMDNAKLLKNVWVTAGDLNTDDVFIEHVIQNDVGLPTCQATLGRIISEKLNTRDLSVQLSTLIQRRANDYFPLIEAAVGYGVAQCVSLLTQGSKVMIQGFGAVGSSLSYYLEEQGIATVVALCDKDGYIHHPDGLPIKSILSLRKKKVAELRAAEASDSDIVECSKNFFTLLSVEQRKEWNAVPRDPSVSSQDFLCSFLSSEEATVVCPCAQRYQITERVIQCMLENGWKGEQKYLISGANNPYGVECNSELCEDTRGSVLQLLSAHGVCVVPDWVANSGTAQLFHRGLSLDFEHQSAEAVLEACAQPIRAFLFTALKFCKVKTSYLVYACAKLAAERLKQPILMSAKVNKNPAASIYCLSPPSVKLPLEERLRRCSSVAEECINGDELEVLLRMCENPVAYDGFEPSGRMHIAQGLLKTVIVNRMTASGFTFLFWIADWFAQMNHKMGGNLEDIQTVGRYFIEIWKACGMDMSRVKFLWASDEIKKRNDEYWSLILDISSNTTNKRIERCMTIMGRTEKDSLTASQTLYPCMQCADIFFLGVDVCQLGMDQRKVNMLAREYAAKAGKQKPIILSHHMLMGLKKGQVKMSKSDNGSAIFMEDSEEDVCSKIRAAYCPPMTAVENPCMDYMKHIVFPLNKDGISVNNLHFLTYEELQIEYVNNVITPKELKDALSTQLNRLLTPIRTHFKNNKAAASLLEKVKRLRA